MYSPVLLFIFMLIISGHSIFNSQSLYDFSFYHKYIQDSSFNLSMKCSQDFEIATGMSFEEWISFEFVLLIHQSDPTINPLIDSTRDFFLTRNVSLSQVKRFGDYQSSSSSSLESFGGDYDKCLSLPSSHFCRNLVTIPAPDETYNDVPLALCLPSSCQTNDSASISSFFASFFIFSTYGIWIETTTEYSECGDFAWSYDGWRILLIVVFLLIVLLVIIATFIDSYSSSRRNLHGLSIQSNELTAPLIDSDDNKTSINTKLEVYTSPLSLYSGVKSLNPPEKSRAGNVDALNGIRVLSMAWVILGHTALWPLYTSQYSNIEFLDVLAKRWHIQIIVNALFSVDTFFWLSGFLLGYTILNAFREKQKVLQPKDIFSAMAYRWLRLTPIYIFVILFMWQLFGLVSNGPYWPLDTHDTNCDKTLYMNLLYINNFQDSEDMCLGWSWYLANDFQFGIIGIIILFLHIKFINSESPKYYISYIIIFFIWLGSVITTFAISEYYDLGATTIVDERVMDKEYIKPYCRIPAYLIGLALSIYFDWSKNNDFADYDTIVTKYYLSFKEWKDSHSYIYRTIILLISIGIISLCVFITAPLFYEKPYGTPWTQAQSSAYQAFSRTGYSIGLCLLLYYCISEENIINNFLSSRMWYPLAKLTYSAYLIHPLAMAYTYSSRHLSPYLSPKIFSFDFLGFFLFSYGIAFFMYTFIEYPFGVYTNALMRIRSLSKYYSNIHKNN